MPATSRSRLDPRLIPIDLLLDRWVHWSSRELEKLGYGRSMSAKLIEWHELGVEPDHYLHLRQLEACPPGVLMADRLVGRLDPPLHNAVMVQYFLYAPVERKAKACHQSVPSFRRNLDRALWALHQAMKVLEIDFDVDGNLRELRA